MNDQERQVISEIFERLEQVADQPRDPEAERFIQDRVRRQPYAPYAMAQAIVVQEQALKNLNEQLEALAAENEELRQPPARRVPVEHLRRRWARVRAARVILGAAAGRSLGTAWSAAAAGSGPGCALGRSAWHGAADRASPGWRSPEWAVRSARRRVAAAGSSALRSRRRRVSPAA